jgi:hypothetical protein
MVRDEGKISAFKLWSNDYLKRCGMNRPITLDELENLWNTEPEVSHWPLCFVSFLFCASLPL